jgi:uncharacterized coiled-coil protein SlyX
MPSYPKRVWPLLVPAVLLAAACGPTAQIKARLATLDTVSAQKDSLIQELALQAQTLSAVTSELAKVHVRNLRVSSESPAAAQRDTMVQKVRYLVARVQDSESRLRSSDQRIRNLTFLSDSLRTMLENTVASLQETIDAQKEQIAALSATVDTLQIHNAALTDTLANMSVRENTVYYVIGTRDQLKEKGLVVEEGGSRVLWVLWKTGQTLQTARDLDPAQFTTFDKRLTDIPLPYGDGVYRILSRQDTSSLATKPDDHGRITGASLRIASPGEFWRNSKFLVILVEKTGTAPQSSTD